MRFTTALLLLFTASILGACGGADDVEVNLPFVGNIMAKNKADEEKMANRGTLVLPPSVKGLPEPLTKQQVANQASWPADPDEKAKSDAELAALKDAEYRKHGDWKGERDTGNGLEDFKNKIDWSRRQPGVLRSVINKPENK
jgi:hypothetical protein